MKNLQQKNEISNKYAIVHIADIHFKKDEPEGASTIIKAFLKDLTNQKDSLSGYTFYIAVTGDIVFSGDDKESYESFIKEFNQRLDDIELIKSFRMIVPGNHDVERNVVKKNLEDHKNKVDGNILTEGKFNNFVNKDNILNSKFENYELFEADFAKYGIDFSAQGHGWKVDNNLGVYCLNTALCSFGGVDNIKDIGKLAIETRKLVDWCDTKDTDTNILLMHHPIDCLKSWCKDELKRIIENNFSLCLCGHSHKQDIFYNKLSQKSLICSAPQLFTNKDDNLGYAIILIEKNTIDKIVYRQYVKGNFLNGIIFSENNDGVVNIHNNHDMQYKKNKKILEDRLKNALAFFKGQPEIFIEPLLSKTREFNNEENALESMIKTPQSTIIVAQPQFGLTCLSHYMRAEAYKQNDFWIYLDANNTKARKVKKDIDEQLQSFDESTENIKCIIIDSWNESVIDHRNILKCIDNDFTSVPIVVMSNYSEINFGLSFDFNKLNNNFELLHLQALQRNKVREFVSQYNQKNNIAKEDDVVTKVVKDLEVLNIHRTPLNCLTLLKVFEKDFNEDLVNRTKLVKTVLFILFTNADSFTYSSDRPDVEDCEYIIGRFCKLLIKEHTRKFSSIYLMNELKKYCSEKLISVDIEAIVDILESNNILLRSNDELEFKHRYWIFYFAATYMLRDENFKDYIFTNKNYVNFPEIVEFYTGIDGRREKAVQILLNDTKQLIDTVNSKIGISEIFNPFEGVVWDPSPESIETIRKDILEKVEKSNLPSNIKDLHADKEYDSEAPYDQTINKFLNEYSVISLVQSIKASSRALRNSNYIEPDLKINMSQTIINGWDQISKVIFWLSPTLAKLGKVTYDGFGLILTGGFKGSKDEKLKSIYLANPFNVVNYFKDDLSSKKIGPILFKNLENNSSEIQKHFLLLFLLKEKPNGWYKELFEYMNLLHRNSFYLGDLYDNLNNEIKNGFISDDELVSLKKLVSIVVAKHKNAPKLPKGRIKKIPDNMTINKKNKLPLDKILASGK